MRNDLYHSLFISAVFVLYFLSFSAAAAQRHETLLRTGWRFVKGEQVRAEQVGYDDSGWQVVSVPHDWAIYGPFDRSNDLQQVAISQNHDEHVEIKTGRTGGLPYVGVGWYRLHHDVATFDASRQCATLIFDGAMSQPRVYVNGAFAGEWKYGYNSFSLDVSDKLHQGDNVIAVRLENEPESSRWYPGAGLFRNVHLVITDKTHVDVWGTHVTTPFVTDTMAVVRLKTDVKNSVGKTLKVVTSMIDRHGIVITSDTSEHYVRQEIPVEQNFIVHNPSLWTPESPLLYELRSDIYADGKLVDSYSTRCGIRKVEVVPGLGFMLNGNVRKFKGVCLHHDLGPLGAAVNRAALRHQIVMLKDMGADAIRTTHNMPAPELVELCDEMGMMLFVEPFDEWDVEKCKNGYHKWFEQWVERDMRNMLVHYRNAPSIVMWSVGNEVPTQCSNDGYKVASRLQQMCVQYDGTRPISAGMDQVSCVLENGFASVLQVPGLNYRTHRYVEAYENLPQGVVLGSETASTVSSRGVYHFPVVLDFDAINADKHCSSYDVEYSNWSNTPDQDFALQDDYPWTIGQFVWTGFDYLGEPSPYDNDSWPSHGSYYGIIDLASIPKDRYWLYRSQWNSESPTLHVLPHWTWHGREGQKTPVFVYTSYPEAELFINGKSMGRKAFAGKDETECKLDGIRPSGKEMKPWGSPARPDLLQRYRLMWTLVNYEPGEIRVVAYDDKGNKAAEKIVRTAGKPHHIIATADRDTINANGEDLAYITLSVVDKDGNLCPDANNTLNVKVEGCGTLRALGNGDQTSVESFQGSQMHAFHGMMTAIVQSKNSEQRDKNQEARDKSLDIVVTISGKGLKEAKIVVKCE